MTKSSAWDFEHLHDLCGHEEVSGQHIPQNQNVKLTPPRACIQYLELHSTIPPWILPNCL